MAALCLEGQPFGFTWEDVAQHRWSVNYWQVKINDPTTPLDETHRPVALYEKMRDWHKSMADRIEALLPPEAG